MNGVISINKPRGLSSFQIAKKAQSLSSSRKAGHGGTLDLEAEGLILVLLNEATKAFDFFLKWPKTYYADIKLGYSSDTLDADGTITISKDFSAEIDDFKLIIKNMIGSYTHKVPEYSAKKFKGKTFYDLKRNGKTPPERFQTTQIYDMRLIDYKNPVLSIEVDCSSGTYIRSIAADIAAKLGTDAYIERLVRIKVGPFSIEDAIDLDNNSWQKGFLDLNTVMKNFPHVVVSNSAAKLIRYGRPFQSDDISAGPLNNNAETREYIVYAENSELLGISHLEDDGSYKIKRLFLHEDNRI